MKKHKYKSYIDSINHYLSEELGLVRQFLISRLKKVVATNGAAGIDDDFVERIVTHLFKKEGKLLRPILTLLSAGLGGEPREERRTSLIHLAAAVELLHSASLVHDDVIDEASERRGVPSLNSSSSNSIAVLVGDILYSQFFYIITNLEGVPEGLRLKLFHIFSDLTTNMCMGEIFQHEVATQTLLPNQQSYLKIIKNKTALLMSACCKCGSMLSESSFEQPSELEHACEKFGLNFGFAYQLIDDFHDQDTYVPEAIDLLNKAENYIENAESSIKNAPDTESKTHLLHLCLFLRDRCYT